MLLRALGEREIYLRMPWKYTSEYLAQATKTATSATSKSFVGSRYGISPSRFVGKGRFALVLASVTARDRKTMKAVGELIGVVMSLQCVSRPFGSERVITFAGAA